MTTPDPARVSSAGERPPVGDRPLETPRAAGVAGLAFAVALHRLDRAPPQPSPRVGSTAAAIRDFYLEPGTRASVALVGVYLAPFSGIAFLWFIAAIRHLIGDREDRFFATVFLGSGLLFVAMMFLAAGVGGSLLAAVKFQGAAGPERGVVVAVRSSPLGFSSSTPCGWPRCS